MEQWNETNKVVGSLPIEMGHSVDDNSFWISELVREIKISNNNDNNNSDSR